MKKIFGILITTLLCTTAISSIGNNYYTIHECNYDVGIYRPSTGKWYYDYDLEGETEEKDLGGSWGWPGDLPVSGDFDSDGIDDDTGVFRASEHKWYFDYDHDRDTDETSGPHWGEEGDLPIAGDFNRDGINDDIGIFRPSTGVWYYDWYHDGITDETGTYYWGEEGDLPIVGDFNFDWYNDDVGVFRPSEHKWYYDIGHDGTTDKTAGPSFGEEGDLPIAGKFDREPVPPDDPNVEVGLAGQWQDADPYDFYAQSFKPTQTCLYNRIRLPLRNRAYQGDIKVSIRSSLTGADLATAIRDADTVTYNDTGAGYDFDLEPDIVVTKGNTYYLMFELVSLGTDLNILQWMIDKSNPYSDGNAWYETIGGWQPYSGWDFCFTTYQTNIKPNKPTINGPTNCNRNAGCTYTVSATDLDWDVLYYLIDWDDGTTSGWLGPFLNGESTSVDHSWSSDNDYGIRVQAKDIHGFKSDFATLTVSVTKNKAKTIDILLLRLLNNYPLLHQLIQRFFKP